MRKLDFLWAGLIALVMMVGCQNSPMTPQESIGRAYVTVSTISDATIEAYRVGAISDRQAESIWRELQQALDLIGIAQQSVDQGLVLDDEPLLKAQAILQTIHDILEAAQ